jgi:hypothetical protein
MERFEKQIEQAKALLIRDMESAITAIVKDRRV